MRTLIYSICALYFICFAESSISNGAFDYHRKFGIPEADRIRKFEESLNESRISGGGTTLPALVPYQAGLVITLSFFSTSVCGAAIISDIAVLTAAHCHTDGSVTSQSITVVLGSNLLFSGGTRIVSNDVVVNPGYNPSIAANDLAIIRVSRITFSLTISSIALPSGSELNEQFAGWKATASGFGITRHTENVGLFQFLKAVELDVITNAACANAYGSYIQSHHICTSGANGDGMCPGDFGGPLVTVSNGRRILIGIGSFNSAAGCDTGTPSAYTRITNFLSWIYTI